jgi:hypothetical protein
MNCSLDRVAYLITAAIAALVAAITASYLWITAWPLFGAAALVAGVSFYFIPAIKKALEDYARCRGPSDKCRISLAVNNLGQAAAILSVVAFAAAALMQVAALFFIASLILSWIGVGMMVAVAFLVKTGQFSCAMAALILLGVLSNAWAFKKCMDGQQDHGSDSGGVIR